MKHVSKSVLLWYSPREMYTLVTAVEDYPQFLPWCARGEVLERSERGMTARLHLAYMGVRHAFTTRNVHVPDRQVTLALIDGPFSTLEGHWRFQPLAVPGGEKAGACKIEFELRYAFSSGALEAVVSPVFDKIANTFVDSFVKRAEQVHGPPADAAVLAVTVAYSPRAGEVDETLVQLPAGATLRDALNASGLAVRHPQVDFGALKCGVWSKLRELSAALRERDRVEFYRPLQVDPKEARRLRYKQHRERYGAK